MNINILYELSTIFQIWSVKINIAIQKRLCHKACKFVNVAETL